MENGKPTSGPKTGPGYGRRDGFLCKYPLKIIIIIIKKKFANHCILYIIKICKIHKKIFLSFYIDFHIYLQYKQTFTRVVYNHFELVSYEGSPIST